MGFVLAMRQKTKEDAVKAQHAKAFQRKTKLEALKEENKRLQENADLKKEIREEKVKNIRLRASPILNLSNHPIIKNLARNTTPQKQSVQSEGLDLAITRHMKEERPSIVNKLK